MAEGEGRHATSGLGGRLSLGYPPIAFNWPHLILSGKDKPTPCFPRSGAQQFLSKSQQRNKNPLESPRFIYTKSNFALLRANSLPNEHTQQQSHEKIKKMKELSNN
jgi:hypothetical protein